MQLLTTEGTYAPVPSAADFSGGQHLTASQGARTIKLVDGPGGSARYARYIDIYRTNPWVYAAVNLKARALGRLPIHVFAFDADGNRQRIRSDLPRAPGRPTGPEQLDRLLRRPEPGVSRRNLLSGAMRDRSIFDNVLIEILKENDGSEVTGLRRHRWADVDPQLTRDGTDIIGFSVPDGTDRNPRRRRMIPRDQAIHITEGDVDGPLGVSPIEAMQYTQALYDAVGRYLLSYFTNQASPSGHVKIDQKGDKAVEAAARVRRMILEAYASPENAGKVLVTSGEWKSIGETPEHSQVVDLIKYSREEAAAAFGIPQPLLGILDRAIMSNVKELRSFWTRDVLGPDADLFEQEFGVQLLPHMNSWVGLFVEFKLAEQLRPDPETEAEMLRNSSWLTIDEKRRIQNRQPLNIPGVTDVPILPSGEQPAPSAQRASMAANGLWTPPPGDGTAALAKVTSSRNGHSPR